MDEFNRADIHAARRLRRNQKFRLLLKLSCHDDFLLIPARKIPRQILLIRWPHVEFLNQPGGLLADRREIDRVEKAAPRHERRAIMHAQNHVLRDGVIQHEAAPVAIFGNMRHALLARAARRQIRHVPLFQQHLPLPRFPQAGQDFDQFGLAVPFDAR